MENYLKALHQFLTATGHISQSHVVAAAQNGEQWARDRVASLRVAIRAVVDEMDTLTPDGAGLRAGPSIKLPGQ